MLYCFAVSILGGEESVNYKNLGQDMISLMNLIKREMDNNCDTSCVKGITFPNARFVVYLMHNQDKDVYQKNLEEAFSLRPPTVSRSLKMLEEQGYIIRTASAYDSRLKKITLTEKSMKISESFEKSMADALRKMTVGISDEELSAFSAALSKMKRNLSES